MMVGEITITSVQHDAVVKAAARALYVAQLPCCKSSTLFGFNASRCGSCRTCRAKKVLEGLAEFEKAPKEGS